MAQLRLLTVLEVLLYGGLIALLVIMPSLLDEDTFVLNRLAKFLVYGLLAAAVALSWGYAGVLNLGMGLFFGLGAYTTAMSLKLQSYTSLQQGSDKPIPDFMMWNSEPGAEIDLCCIVPGSALWIPFQEQWFGFAMALLIPALVALTLGYAVFRLRISGVFIAIITLALVLLVRLVIIDMQPLTNGFNGLTDLGWLTIGGYEFDPYLYDDEAWINFGTYYLVTGAVVVVLIAARILVSTRAGMILQATRDDANRARYLGYNVAGYQVFFFTASAFIAGIAGSLFVLVADFADPTLMDLAFSISMVVWAAVGGRASLLGAMIGAVTISYLQVFATEDGVVEFLAANGLLEGSRDGLNDWLKEGGWQVVVGLVFILVVLILPRGLAGLAHDTVEWIARRFRRRTATDGDSGGVGLGKAQPAPAE